MRPQLLAVFFGRYSRVPKGYTQRCPSFVYTRTDECPRVDVLIPVFFWSEPPLLVFFACPFFCLNPLFWPPATLGVLLTRQVGVVDLRGGGTVLHLPHAVLLLQVAQGQGS